MEQIHIALMNPRLGKPPFQYPFCETTFYNTKQGGCNYGTMGKRNQ